MTNNQKNFLNLLFNPGEEVYASPDKYSSSWDEEKQQWKIYRPSVLVEDVQFDTNLIGMNPIKGMVRKDANVTAYRSFLVEMDGGTLEEQKKIVDASGLPYSCCVFSGSKSLHFIITLDQDLPSEDIWRFFAEWILKTIPEADQSTKNPSRGTRYPDAIRLGTENLQRLVVLNERVSLNRLRQYLSKHADKTPVQKSTYDDMDYKEENKTALANWLVKGIQDGFDFSIGRNNRWFAVGVEFAKCGYSFEVMVEDILSKVYEPEASFPRSEWIATLKSGYKHGRQKYFGSRN